MEKKTYPSDTLGRYIVRFPEGMRERLKASAEGNNRTLNAEIVARLEASYKADWDSLRSSAREIDLMAEGLQSRGEMLSLRAELLRARYDSLLERIREVSSEIKRMEAAGDARLAAVEESAARLAALRDEAAAVHAERDTLLTARGKLEEQSRQVIGEIMEARTKAEGIATRLGTKKPAK